MTKKSYPISNEILQKLLADDLQNSKDTLKKHREDMDEANRAFGHKMAVVYNDTKYSSIKTDNEDTVSELKNFGSEETNTLSVSKDRLLSFNEVAISTPVGMISAFAHKADVDGWLYCDGRKVNKKDYPKLYALIRDDWWNKSVNKEDEINKAASSNGTSATELDYFYLPDLRGTFLRCLDDGKGLDHEKNRQIGTYQADEFKSHSHYLAYEDEWYSRSLYRDGNGIKKIKTSGEAGGDTRDTGGEETCPKNITVAYHIKAK